MDTYQAIYDAVRSKIGAASSDQVIERAARDAFDMGHASALLQEQIGMVGNEMVRPSVLWRPALSMDGTMWCALYGENLVEGVAGFGETPEAAMRAFDDAWWKQRTSDAIRRSHT
jgi:hypothetical protein